MQRALDALFEGSPVPADAQAGLTDAERAEIAEIAATAHLTRLVLSAPEPPSQAEASSLRQAKNAVHSRPPSAAAAPPSDNGGARGWLARWRRKR